MCLWTAERQAVVMMSSSVKPWSCSIKYVWKISWTLKWFFWQITHVLIHRCSFRVKLIWVSYVGCIILNEGHQFMPWCYYFHLKERFLPSYILISLSKNSWKAQSSWTCMYVNYEQHYGNHEWMKMNENEMKQWYW